MNENQTGTSRRNFLKSSLTLPVALAAAPGLLAQSASAADAPAAASADVLPLRTLGKSGRQVTMLCMGGMMAALSPDYLDIAWSMGIRYFDTADCYIHGQSERSSASGSPNTPSAARKSSSSPRITPTKAPSNCSP